MVSDVVVSVGRLLVSVVIMILEFQEECVVVIVVSVRYFVGFCNFVVLLYFWVLGVLIEVYDLGFFFVQFVVVRLWRDVDLYWGGFGLLCKLFVDGEFWCLLYFCCFKKYVWKVVVIVVMVERY